MSNLERLRALFAWFDSRQERTFQQSDDNGDGTSRLMIGADKSDWGVAVRPEVLRSILNELECWNWLTEMACTVQANADIHAMKWTVLDVDNEIVGAGNTPIDAIENARSEV